MVSVIVHSVPVGVLRAYVDGLMASLGVHRLYAGIHRVPVGVHSVSVGVHRESLYVFIGFFGSIGCLWMSIACL